MPVRILLCQNQGNEFSLFLQFVQSVFKGAACQIQAAFQRLFHPHVEPGFDALLQKLDRNGIDQHAGQHRDQRKKQNQTQGEPRAVDLLPQISAQLPDLVQHQQQQPQHQYTGQRQQG